MQEQRLVGGPPFRATERVELMRGAAGLPRDDAGRAGIELWLVEERRRFLRAEHADDLFASRALGSSAVSASTMGSTTSIMRSGSSQK